MNELIEKLTEDFKKTILHEEQQEKLLLGFRKVLIDTIESYKKDNYEEDEIKNSIIRISNRWINLDVEEKKRRLLFDSNLGDIINISEQAYKAAVSIYMGNEVNIDFNISNKIEELENSLKKVEDYNKEYAKVLVSEGILDLKFIENQNVEMTSLRLGHIKNNKGDER